jgi:thioredoxin 2
MAQTQTQPVTIRCPKCGALNRVQPDRVASGQAPVCGRCKTSLPTGGTPVTVTDATFAAEVERSPIPVLVDLWAPWCGPCRAIAPAIDQLASEFAGRARVAKMNIDENPATAARLNAASIPLLLIFKDGKEVDRLVGLMPKDQIARRLERVIT